jgi:hypothetical protein
MKSSECMAPPTILSPPLAIGLFDAEFVHCNFQAATCLLTPQELTIKRICLNLSNCAANSTGAHQQNSLSELVELCAPKIEKQ